jgi:two-component system chemotaxis sensor kinase CheA
VAGTSATGLGWFCRCEGELLPARPLARLLGFAPGAAGQDLTEHAHGVVVAETRAGRAALLVDAFAGQEEVFVRPLAPPLSHLDALSGITVLGSGRPVLVVDPNALGPSVVPAPAERSPG